MLEAASNPLAQLLPRRAPRVSYRQGEAVDVLAEAGVLAVFGFGGERTAADDPRWLRVALESFEEPAPLEVWTVDGAVSHGRQDALRWSAGDGWLFAAIELDEATHGGPRDTAQQAYRQLLDFVAQRRERHVLRMWNYLGAINHGADDAERYKQFCDGRAAGMGDFFSEGFPAATAIGHHATTHALQAGALQAAPLQAIPLQVYLLACDQAGERVENPRQVSAWRYPRQYGRTPPSFARAMNLPASDALAISGTAAVVGHASAHAQDLQAQLLETFANLDALLDRAGMVAGFDTHSPLKAYVRDPVDAATVREFIQQRLPGVPVLLLHGDICRRELLVEIDGWRYA
jgi:chorismate lyase/3-hydroxybenzoate synthase